MTTTLQPTFSFLNSLKEHNDRAWFNDHKNQYEESQQNMIEFAEGLLDEMRKHDNIETVSGRKSLFRIYRDVRFSKNKNPYKTNRSGSFKRETNELRGGYYFHIEPSNTFLAGGFFGPNASDLKHIRNHISQDDAFLRKVLESKPFKSYFGVLEGDQVKTAPKGFAKDHPAIDLLKYKQFILRHKFTDKEVLQKDFAKKMSDGFQHLRPFLDVMSEILTTDLNGLSLI